MTRWIDRPPLWLIGLLLGGCASPATGPLRTSPATAPPVAEPVRREDLLPAFESALALLDARRFDDAEQAFAGLCETHSRYSGPCTNLGMLRAQRGDPEGALRALERAVQARPDNAPAWNLIGVLHRQGGAMEAAERAYQRALEADPRHAPAHLNLALLYERHRPQPKAAIAHYRAWQRLMPEDPLPVTAWIRALESQVVPDVAVARSAP